MEEWKREKKSRDHKTRRKSAISAVSATSNGSTSADYLTTPDNFLSGRRGSAYVESAVPRIYRAKSHAGSERLELPMPGRIQRAYSHCTEVPITLTPLKSPHGIFRVKKYN